jgi:hypothetical protein
VGDDGHPEPVPEAGEARSDVAEPDDPEGLAAELHGEGVPPRLVVPHPRPPGEG